MQQHCNALNTGTASLWRPSSSSGHRALPLKRNSCCRLGHPPRRTTCNLAPASRIQSTNAALQLAHHGCIRSGASAAHPRQHTPALLTTLQIQVFCAVEVDAVASIPSTCKQLPCLYISSTTRSASSYCHFGSWLPRACAMQQ